MEATPLDAPEGPPPSSEVPVLHLPTEQDTPVGEDGEGKHEEGGEGGGGRNLDGEEDGEEEEEEVKELPPPQDSYSKMTSEEIREEVGTLVTGHSITFFPLFPCVVK